LRQRAALYFTPKFCCAFHQKLFQVNVMHKIHIKQELLSRTTFLQFHYLVLFTKSHLTYDGSIASKYKTEILLDEASTY